MIFFIFILNGVLFYLLSRFVFEKMYDRLLSVLEEKAKVELQNFWRMFPLVLLIQFTKMNWEPLSFKKLSHLSQRLQQLFMASQTLSLGTGFLIAMFFSFILPGGFFFGEALSRLAMGLEEFHWVFYLSTNYLLGTLSGALFGLVVGLLVRRSGILFWLPLQGVYSGVMSLGLAWGILLGDLLAGVISHLIRNRESDDFRYRYTISILVLVLLIGFSGIIQNFVQTFQVSSNAIQERLIHLMVLFVFWAMVDFGLNMVFFHFRAWSNSLAFGKMKNKT